MAEKLEDLNLPNAVVTRIIKQAITDNIMISKEARTALGRAASVFVLYITSAATNVSKKHNRKTVTGQDVLDAMSDLEFEEFVEPLNELLDTFRKSKKDVGAKKAKKADGAEVDAEQEPEAEGEAEGDEDMDADEDDEEEQEAT